MKRKVLVSIALTFMAMAVVGIWGCISSDDDVTGQIRLSDLLKAPSSHKNITSITNVTWKLYGYGVTNTGLVRKSESLDNNWQNIVLFTEDGSFSGHTSSNDLFGEYTISGSNIEIIRLGGTKVGEILDGIEFHKALQVCQEYKITNNWLLLYYNEGQNILIFKVLK